MHRRIWLIVLLAMAVLAGCSSQDVETQATSPQSEAFPGTLTTGSANASGAANATATGSSNTGTEAAKAKAAAKPKPLQITESGYSLVSGPHVEYAFVLRNPNADFAVMFPEVKVTMRDAAGHVLGTDDVTLRWWFLPGETIAYAQEIDPKGGRPTRVDFEVVDPGVKWQTAAKAQPWDRKPIKTSNLKVTKTASGMIFTTDLENPNSVGIDDFAVSVVLRDKSGHIVGGYTGIGEDLYAGEKKKFAVKSSHDIPKFATAEVHAQIWGD